MAEARLPVRMTVIRAAGAAGVAAGTAEVTGVTEYVAEYAEATGTVQVAGDSEAAVDMKAAAVSLVLVVAVAVVLVAKRGLRERRRRSLFYILK